MRLSCCSYIDCSLVPVVALRIELSAAWLSAELGQPTLDYRSFLPARTVGREALESSSAVLQTVADHAAHGARVSATDPTKKPGVACDTGF